ncbi:Fc receptor-like protein 5 [Trichomycterus rosablanca]|uniref:Fc receptor-like protein 5 n=1 Tax=Trichomycterus rosablanca TaxID=2290929 RepID=UPI002F352D34
MKKTSVKLLILLVQVHKSEERPKAVLKLLPDGRIFSGEKVTFTCEIQDTNKDWKYNWFKDDHKLSCAGENREYSFVTTEQHSSSYTCSGQREICPRNSEISNTVTLTVSAKPKPTVTGVPQSFIYTGEAVTLNCELQEQQSTEWTFNWYKITGTHSTNTNSLSVPTTNAGETKYQCKAQRRNYDSEFSDSVTITVKERPKAVLKLLPGGQIFSGEHVTLTCEIQDTSEDWKYNWFKDNKQLSPANENREYSFVTTEQHSGRYTCSGESKIYSQNSEISNTVTLTVSEKPKAVLKLLPGGQIFSGEHVKLTCEIQDTSEDWMYNWFKNGHKLSSAVENRDYSFTATERYSGSYTCSGQSKIHSQNSEISNTVTLTVSEKKSSNIFIILTAKPKPTVTGVPQSFIYTGEAVTLYCELQEQQSTEWTFIWYKIIHNQLTPVTPNTNPLRVPTTYAGETEYQCKARRRNYDSEFSKRVTITVKERPKPSVDINPDNLVFTGETVTLRCDIQDGGVSLWQYSWYKDGSDVSSKQEYRISGVGVTHAGSYTCKGRSGSRSTHISDAVTLTVSVKPKPKLTSSLNGAALTGNSVTLYCELDPQSAGWKFYWFKHTQNHQTESTTHSYIISSVSVSDVGQYQCRARRGNPVYYTHYSDALWVNVTESPKAVVTIKPDNQVFSGETVTLRCDIQRGGDAEWRYSWYENNNNMYSYSKTQEFSIRSVSKSHGGKYTCRGERKSDSQNSEISDTVILTVSERPQPVLNVSIQNWLTEGDSVTLSCEVRGSTTGWIFSWYKVIQYSSSFIRREDLVLLSDTSRGAGGSYTLSPAVLNHTGVYVCRAERGEPAYHTQYSQPQPLWITGESGPVSLIISPNRTQHFFSHFLSLSCKGQRDSTGWRVKQYRESKEVLDCLSDWKSASGSTCSISYLHTSNTGVYWCQSESGDSSNPVNITVHDGDVILDSPVHPVTEGHSLTLRCLYGKIRPVNLQADFYKDDSVLKNQTEKMIIHSVSKSDEGFYHCKHPEKGESPKSWISVRVLSRSHSEDLLWVLRLMTVSLFVLSTIILVNIYYRTRAKPDETERWNREYEVIEAEASC